MLYAVKDNKVYSIDEIEKDSYIAKGFDITNEEGAIIEYNVDKTVSYTEYASLLAEKEKLEKEVEKLEKEVEKLKKTAKDTAEKEKQKVKETKDEKPSI